MLIVIKNANKETLGPRQIDDLCKHADDVTSLINIHDTNLVNSESRDMHSQ